MNQIQSVSKIKEVKNQCSICGKYFITKVFPDRTYKGGNCFRPVGSKSKKDESWECDSCWEKPLVAIKSSYQTS